MIDYLLHIGILAVAYGTVSISVSVLLDDAGVLPLHQGAMMGVGAYTGVFVLLHYNVGIFGILGTALLVLIIAALVGFLLGLIMSTLRDEEFALASLAGQLILVSFFMNADSITQGPLGIGNIPPIEVGGFRLRESIHFFPVILFFGMCYYAAVMAVKESSFGLVLRAARDDDVWAATMGIDVEKRRAVVIAFSASLTALVGFMLGYYLGYIAPEMFDINESILIITIIIIAGRGRLGRVAIGAALLVVGPELLRLMGSSSEVSGAVRQIAVGAILVAMGLYVPTGYLVGEPS